MLFVLKKAWMRGQLNTTGSISFQIRPNDNAGLSHPPHFIKDRSNFKIVDGVSIGQVRVDILEESPSLLAKFDMSHPPLLMSQGYIFAVYTRR